MNKRFNWKAFSHTPEALFIAKEERKVRRNALAKPKKATVRKTAKTAILPDIVADDPELDTGLAGLDNLPTFEPQHQVFRMHGVIVRKGEKIHESHGPRGREKKLLCDRRQTIRKEVA